VQRQRRQRSFVDGSRVAIGAYLDGCNQVAEGLDIQGHGPTRRACREALLEQRECLGTLRVVDPEIVLETGIEGEELGRIARHLCEDIDDDLVNTRLMVRG